MHRLLVRRDGRDGALVAAVLPLERLLRALVLREVGRCKGHPIADLPLRWLDKREGQGALSGRGGKARPCGPTHFTVEVKTPTTDYANDLKVIINGLGKGKKKAPWCQRRRGSLRSWDP